MKNIEQELKIMLDERTYRIIAKEYGGTTRIQYNHYFYYDGMPDSQMLRMRQTDGRYQLTYKQRLTEKDGVFVCDEYNADLSSEVAARLLTEGVAAHQARVLLGVDLQENYRYVGSLTTVRTKFDMQGFAIELDADYYLGHTDYELECENTCVEQLDRLKSLLAYKYSIRALPSAAKSQRYLEKLAGIPMPLD
ncbi:MAG: CYTH domain-containing protein [Corallococcus sp.]|nr:CYTH domain-containing protein [Corallococcus sp.]